MGEKHKGGQIGQFVAKGIEYFAKRACQVAAPGYQPVNSVHEGWEREKEDGPGMLFKHKIEHRTQEPDNDPPYADAMGMEIPASS